MAAGPGEFFSSLVMRIEDCPTRIASILRDNPSSRRRRLFRKLYEIHPRNSVPKCTSAKIRQKMFVLHVFGEYFYLNSSSSEVCE